MDSDPASGGKGGRREGGTMFFSNTGAPSLVHLSLVPKSAITRSPPMLPLAMALSKMRPVWWCRSMYMRCISGCLHDPVICPALSGSPHSGHLSVLLLPPPLGKFVFPKASVAPS